MTKFNPDDICVICSKTSHSNNSIVRVLYYTNGDRTDIIRVESCDKSTAFNISEDSLRLATKYDLIRSMSDTQLELLLQVSKEFHADEEDIKNICGLSSKEEQPVLQPIGYDNTGNPLFVGDKCTFSLETNRPTGKYDRNGQMIYSKSTDPYQGIIVYDDDSFGYAFDIDDNYCPMILMDCVEYGSICKIKESENE